MASIPDSFAGGPCKTDEVAKSAIHQTLYDARSYETRGPCYQYPIVRADDEGIVCLRLRCVAALVIRFRGCNVGPSSIHLLTPQGTRVSTLSSKAMSK